MLESLNNADAILRRCRELGFARAGVASAEPTQYVEELRDWLKAGKHGSMAYMEKNLEALLDPNRILPGVQSIICVADRYHIGAHEHIPEPYNGQIAKYARGNDYHKTIKKRLQQLADELRRDYPQHQFRACVDTAPLLEREYAARAGLGAVGKHTLLIEQGVGSYLLLGEILTTMELPTSEANIETPADPCGSCTRCIDACPTNAISPWSVDATRCISYLTIEHRGEIENEFHDNIGQWIFGCDICQEVCPHNQPTRRKKNAPTNDAYISRHDHFDIREVLDWSETDRQTAFTKSAMKRAKLNMMKRNAIIAAGNILREQNDAALRQRLEALQTDSTEDELVRNTARSVLADL